MKQLRKILTVIPSYLAPLERRQVEPVGGARDGDKLEVGRHRRAGQLHVRPAVGSGLKWTLITLASKSTNEGCLPVAKGAKGIGSVLRVEITPVEYQAKLENGIKQIS